MTNRLTLWVPTVPGRAPTGHRIARWLAAGWHGPTDIVSGHAPEVAPDGALVVVVRGDNPEPSGVGAATAIGVVAYGSTDVRAARAADATSRAIIDISTTTRKIPTLHLATSRLHATGFDALDVLARTTLLDNLQSALAADQHEGVPSDLTSPDTILPIASQPEGRIPA